MAVINTNITSLIGQQNLNKSASSLQTAMERLSSGSRINSAKDDAAGQAIANRMSSQITGLSQAQRNANDGISLAQTTEGALNQVNDNLQRIRELTVQATNGTNSQDDLNSIQNEINQRLDEINRISDETGFNGTKVLQSDSGLKIQVGANDGEAITINLKEINAETLGLTGFNVNGKGEVDNTAATKDSLTLAGFELDATTKDNDIQRYTNVLDNKALTASDLFSKVADGGVVTFDGTSTGLNTEAVDDQYTFNADSNSYSFDADDVKNENVIKSLKPATGETATFTVNIKDGTGGGPQNISVDSEGMITSTDTGEKLYLTADGNLSQTNSTGSLNQATLESLAASMTDQAAPDSVVVTENFGTASDAASVDVKFSALEAGQSYTIGDLSFTASESMTADQVATEFSSKINDSTYTTTTGGFGGGFGVTGVTASANTDTLTITTTGNDDGTAFGGANAFGSAASATGRSGTGGTIKSGDTTFTADGLEKFDVTGATIGAEELESVTAGKAHSVNVDGYEYQVANDGSVKQDMQDIYVTENFGDSSNAASMDVEFGNMQSGQTYTLDGVTFTANQDVKAEDVASAFSAALGGNTTSDLGSFTGSFSTMSTSSNYVTSTDGGTLTVKTTADDTGSGLGTTVSQDDNSIDSAAAYVNADGDFVTDDTSTIERFVQDNGVVTDGAARQVFVDQEGELTFDAVTKSERSENPLGQLDDALSQVDSLRSDLGAIQNRFDSAITNLSTTETNISAARSRIEDADYATEVANMTKNQILQQAGTSVLAQANQLPQSVLSLLG